MYLTIERADQLGDALIEERKPEVLYRFCIEDRRYLLVRVLEIVVDHYVLVRSYLSQLLARRPKPDEQLSVVLRLPRAEPRDEHVGRRRQQEHQDRLREDLRELSCTLDVDV